MYIMIYELLAEGVRPAFPVEEKNFEQHIYIYDLLFYYIDFNKCFN